MEIRRITAEDTLPLRHKVLWPGKPVDFCRLPGDDEGLHYGLFLEEKLVSVASVFIEEKSARLRKFATESSFQCRGLGSAMVEHIIIELKMLGIRRFWCDARVSAAGFYRRFSMEQEGEIFQKKGLDYVVMALNL